MSEQSQPGEVQLDVALATLRARLEMLDWGHGLTRNDVRAIIPDLPLALYLHLPDSKRFTNPHALIEAIASSRRRADGEFPNEDIPDLPDDQTLRDHGAPPAWGNDPLLMGQIIESGSATDTQGLEQDLPDVG